MHFGRSVENDMDNATQTKGKREMSQQQKERKRTEILSRWLGVAPEQKRYRDPAIKQG